MTRFVRGLLIYDSFLPFFRPHPQPVCGDSPTIPWCVNYLVGPVPVNRGEVKSSLYVLRPFQYVEGRGVEVLDIRVVLRPRLYTQVVYLGSVGSS